MNQTDIAQPQPAETLPRHRFTLPFSFFAGPAMWALQILIGYALATQSCLAGNKLSMYLLSAAVVLIVLASAFLAYRNWRGYAQGRRSLADIEANVSRQEFVAMGGALLSTMFLFPILLTSVSIIFLSPCPIITMPMP